MGTEFAGRKGNELWVDVVSHGHGPGFLDDSVRIQKAISRKCGALAC